MDLKIKYLSYLLQMYFIEAEIYNVVFQVITLSGLAWGHQLAEKLPMEHCAYTYQAKQCSVIMSYFPRKKPQLIKHEFRIINYLYKLNIFNSLSFVRISLPEKKLV